MLPKTKTEKNKQADAISEESKSEDNSKPMNNIPLDPKLIWATVYLQKFYFKKRNDPNRNFSGAIQTSTGVKKLCEACKQNQIDKVYRDDLICLWCNKCSA